MRLFHDVGVGILCYNDSAASIEKTVLSLLDAGVIAENIFILENGRNSQVAELGKRNRLSGVRSASSVFNNGYTGGNNILLGLLHAEEKCGVLLCNPDIEVGRDTVALMVKTLKECSNVGLVGGLELSGATGAVRSCGGKGHSLFLGRAYWRTDTRVSSPAVAHFVQGACVLVGGSAYRAGVRFDESLFMYYDEVDLGMTSEGLGFKNYVCTDAPYRHYNDSKGFGVLAGYYLQRNRFLIVRKYGTLLQRWVFVCYIFLIELPIKAVIRILQGRREFAWAVCRGAAAGLRLMRG